MLISEGYDITGVVTQPDRPKGRGGKTGAPIVKEIAARAGIRVFQPEKPSEICAELETLSVDLCVTAAYGKILKKRFLRIPRYGTINVHASLLPAYRGPSPIHQALLNGDARTGVTTMLTESGVDTGPTLMSAAVDIEDGDYFNELHDKLAVLGAEILKKTIPEYISGRLKPAPQNDELATYAPIIEKRDGELDFNRNAFSLVNKVKAFAVWPGAIAVLGEKKARVYNASAGDIVTPDGADAHATAERPQYDVAEENARRSGGPAGADSQTAVRSGEETAGAGARAAAVSDGQSGRYAAGTVVRVNRDALSVLCGDGTLFNITRLQFENGRIMDISECWHNLRNRLI